MRKVLPLFLLAAAALGASAAPVSSESARRSAQAFMQQRGRHAALQSYEATLPSGQRRLGVDGSPAYYVFNTEGRQGYVIVSGDDRTEAVLGYADSGEFSYDDMPEAMTGWLQGYEHQMAWLAAHPGAKVAKAPALTAPAIAPLVQAHWGQQSPYNQQCPGQMLTGCVATAMAQVMHYHRCPSGATTSIPSYNDSGTTRPSLPATTFDWDNMPAGTPSTAAQRDAVATLMQYCGWAVEMNYSYSFSGAYSHAIVTALKNYFGYDAGVRYVTRDLGYTVTQWENMVYSELADSRPVIYSGQSSGAGHCFVCDGFDGNGLFHINWGWNGSSDGYFRLSVLNPYDTSGAGASTTEDGYAMDQSIVIGIRPDAGTSSSGPVYAMAKDLGYDGSNLTFSLFNGTPGSTLSAIVGLAELYADGTIGYQALSQYVSWGYNFGFWDLSFPAAPFSNLPVGTHKVVPFSQPIGHEARSAALDGTYWQVTVHSNGTLAVETHPVVSLTPTAWDVVGPKKKNRSHEVKVTLQNQGEECNRLVSLLYRKQGGTSWSEASSSAAYIPAGQSDQLSFFFTPAADGVYELQMAYMSGLYSTKKYQNFGDVYTLQIGDGTPAVTYGLQYSDWQVTPGTTTTLSFTVQNPGTVAYSDIVRLNLYDNDAEFISEEQFVQDYHKASEQFELTIPAGGQTTIERTFTGLKEGHKHHFVFAYHNGEESYQYTTLVDTYFTVEIPAYILSMVGEPMVEAGATTAISFTVQNDGAAAYEKPFRFRFYPADFCADYESSGLGYIDVLQPVAAHSQAVVRCTFEGVQPNVEYWYQIGCFDKDFQYDRLSASDNYFTWEQALPVVYDLALVGGIGIEAGENITASATLLNQGSTDYTGPVYFLLYQNTGTTDAPSFELIGYQAPQVSIPQGGQLAVSAPFSGLVPDVIYAIGLYHLKAEDSDELTYLGETAFRIEAPVLPHVVIRADDKTRVYGDANPPLTYTVVSDDQPTGTPLLTCDAGPASHVGQYVIGIARGTVEEEDLTLENGTLTVTKAPLTITARSYTITQGDPLPDYGVIYDGFKNGETEDVLLIRPTVVCGATSDMAPGIYNIIVAGAEAQNYDISYVFGTLTIEARPVTTFDLSLAGPWEFEVGETTVMRAVVHNPAADDYNLSFQADLYAAPEVPDGNVYYATSVWSEQVIPAGGEATVSFTFTGIQPQREYDVMVWYRRSSEEGGSRLCDVEWFVWEGNAVPRVDSDFSPRVPVVYDLTGRRLDVHSVDMLPAGLYIIDGKKVLRP